MEGNGPGFQTMDSGNVCRMTDSAEQATSFQTQGFSRQCGENLFSVLRPIDPANISSKKLKNKSRSTCDIYGDDAIELFNLTTKGKTPPPWHETRIQNKWHGIK